MENNNIAVGLDIGTTKIVAMIGRKNEYGKMEILGIGKSKSLGVHRGVVNNITQTIQSIQQAVQDAESSSGMKISEVIVGIAGQHIRSLQHSDYITRPNSDEVIDDEDIDRLCDQVHKLVMLPGEEIYPIRNCLEMVMMALTRELPKRGFRIEILSQDNMERLDPENFRRMVRFLNEIVESY